MFQSVPLSLFNGSTLLIHQNTHPIDTVFPFHIFGKRRRLPIHEFYETRILPVHEFYEMHILPVHDFDETHILPVHIVNRCRERFRLWFRRAACTGRQGARKGTVPTRQYSLKHGDNLNLHRMIHTLAPFYSR
jgi:hypothetical protein